MPIWALEIRCVWQASKKNGTKFEKHFPCVYFLTEGLSLVELGVEWFLPAPPRMPYHEILKLASENLPELIFIRYRENKFVPQWQLKSIKSTHIVSHHGCPHYEMVILNIYEVSRKIQNRGDIFRQGGTVIIFDTNSWLMDQTRTRDEPFIFWWKTTNMKEVHSFYCIDKKESSITNTGNITSLKGIESYRLMIISKLSILVSEMVLSFSLGKCWLSYFLIYMSCI